MREYMDYPYGSEKPLENENTAPPVSSKPLFCVFPCFLQTLLQTSVFFLYLFICCGHGQAAPSDSLPTTFQGVENQKLINKFFVMTSLTI